MGNRLDGKVCVITGAGSGIGRASALAFAREGARVAVADVVEASGRETVAQIGEAAGFYPVDVTDEESVRGLYDAVEAEHGQVDVLFNNAGVLLPGDGSVLETTLEAWNRVLAINLTGVFLCCKHGIPKLLAAGGGAVVNMGSISGLVGSATSQIGYAATKGGVISMTRDIAVEFARRGIRANAICPGPVETPLAMQLYKDEQAWERRRVHLPTGALGRAEDVAAVALFLASDEARHVTGASYTVDGGLSIAYTTPLD